MRTLFQQDPSAKIDYQVDWSAWLDGDTIDTSTWSADAGLTVASSPAPSHTTTVATAWLTGGTVGQRYTVTNRIVTAAGRIDERSFVVMVVDR